MHHDSTHVGLDVHKKEISVALLVPGSKTPVVWTCRNEARSVRRLAKRLKREAVGELVCVYEAGPCGYTLQRQLASHGVSATVIAPSLTPVRPGQRIKTDNRDAAKLADLSRSGSLVEVRPPSVEEESVRDLCRCRGDAVTDLTRARHRLSKMLLRLGFVYRQGRNWTKAHRVWLRGLVFENPATRIVFEDYLSTVEYLEERVASLGQAIEDTSQEEPYAELVGWLRCFRGIDTISAMTILSELHGFERFKNPRALMAYLGLIPSVSRSSDREVRGSITKTGNRHVRRTLVEAAWHYRHRPFVGAALRKRRRGQPRAMITLADKAQKRLNRRYHRLILGRGKAPQKVVVALARELAGFIWAAIYLYPKHQAFLQGEAA